MGKMESMLAKMREYLKMDSEIPFAEFRDYYEQVTGYLQANYDGMEKEELFAAKFILDIVSSNSKGRAMRKGPEVKKYKKMGEKTAFWSEAIEFRLKKDGMSKQDIDAAVAAIVQDEGSEGDAAGK